MLTITRKLDFDADHRYTLPITMTNVTLYETPHCWAQMDG